MLWWEILTASMTTSNSNWKEQEMLSLFFLKKKATLEFTIVIHKKKFLYDYTMRIKYDISLQTYDILEDTKNILIMIKNLNKCTF
jgi:hypothetical protein